MVSPRRTELALWPPLAVLVLLGLVAVVPGTSSGVKPGSLYITNSFQSPHSNGSFNHMVVSDKTHDVFIGAVNYLYRLDKNLTLKQASQTGPDLDNVECPPPDMPCNHPRLYTNNVNKVLLIDKANDNLVSCGTLHHGYCENRSIFNISGKVNRFLSSPVVSHNASASTVAFIAPGPGNGDSQPDVMYVSVTWSKAETLFDPIPSLSSRRLTNFTVAFRDNLQYTGTALNLETTQRPQFPVRYVYGFSSVNFSYMLTVQKTAPAHDTYHTVAIRVCQNDKNYYSYMEVPLQCKHQGVYYDILLAAHLATAGRNLAMDLGINVKTDVLYAVFAVGGQQQSPVSTPQTALCVYELNYVRHIFSENIKNCFNGTAKYGGAHLGSSKDCFKNLIYKIDDNYCGETEFNQPLLGTVAVEREAFLTFPTKIAQVSSISVSVTDDYTVAFVGTKDGQMMKISVEPNTTAKIYETVDLVSNSAIKSDMHFDDENEHVYVLTEKKVVKVKVQNCGQYTSCSDCLSARDPYCGWCSLENNGYGTNTCSQKKECQGSDLPKRWLPYDSQECPIIKAVVPHEIKRTKETLLTLDVLNLPDFQQHSTYSCLFTRLVSSNSSRVSTQANRIGNKLQCYTPEASQLPSFEPGKDFVEVKLSVVMNDQELVHKMVTFFDCGVHSSCTTCILSKFRCSWCITYHLCTENPDEHCSTDVLINKSGNTSASQVQQRCPVVDTVETEILVPAGSRQSIKVKGYALQNIKPMDLKCQFVLNDVIEVTAEAVPDPGAAAGTYDIICKEIEFNYFRNISTQNVPLSIVWNSANPIDNPRGIVVVMYKCSFMATLCGECLITEPKYKCGWCNDNHCTTEMFCPRNAGGFRQRGSLCSSPRITTFTPSSGPRDGGTLITIFGENLGSAVDEVQVQIDMVKCDIKDFKAPSRIICESGSSNILLKDHVKVIVGKSGGVTVSAESVQDFSFVTPRITDISPIMGPYAGGTSVTITGEHLDAGSSISVFIGQEFSCTEPVRINSTAITCKTSAAKQSPPSTKEVILKMDNATLQTTGMVFQYVQNPNVTWVSRTSVIRSGGLQIDVGGEFLHHVQSPQILIWYDGQGYSGPCTFTLYPSTNITCISPYINGLNSSFENFRELDFGFKLDDVQSLLKLKSLGKMKVYPDPSVEEYKDKVKVHQQSHEILFITGKNLQPLKPSDIKVHIGKGQCNVTTIASPVITCKPPAVQPAPRHSGHFPEVIVEIGENITQNLGFLRYEQPEELSKEAIIGISVVICVVIVFTIIICIVCFIKNRRNDDMMKKLRKEMDQLESRVANECKEAFAELQTDMSELTSDLSTGSSIPFWDYRTYCMRVLFPPECNDHPVIRELELDYRHREDTERGLKLFFNLIRNKTFLLIFIRTLEANKDFSMKERVNVASLISVSLQTQMEYATEILKTLLAELIEKTVENPKVHPKILLRRNESVAEKMLTNWFTFLLYKFLKECAGEPLFMLYGAIKQQVSKGPVDAVTSEARYSLSEDKLIRQHINYKPLVLNVMDVDVDRCSQPAHHVKVLDCDTVCQVKEKILDALYKSAPFSSRPPKEELDLVLFDHLPEWIVGDKSQVPLKMFPNRDTKRLLLSDDDHTTKMEGDCKRLNSLSHYKVPDGAYVALHPKQTSIYNMSIMSEKSKYSDNSYYNRSPSLNRSLGPPNVTTDVEGCKVYHLVRNQDVESGTKEGERGSKMVSEIYLPRLLVTKGTLQTFVDDLFERIFSTAHRGTALPLAIKYMFDFLDDQALHHNMGDEVVHIWKSNSLPLRFWVNVIKNPNFAFDIYKSNIVDACLTVIGQTFMDCCSTLEHKLTKDSPSGKLLYAKDIPKYKQWVARYYQDIKIMPAISDQDMTAMLAEESRTHQNEFNTNAALLELYKYVKRHYDDIMNALEDDEFAKKSKLTYKLEQVSIAMEGNTVC